MVEQGRDRQDRSGELAGPTRRDQVAVDREGALAVFPYSLDLNASSRVHGKGVGSVENSRLLLDLDCSPIIAASGT